MIQGQPEQILHETPISKRRRRSEKGTLMLLSGRQLPSLREALGSIPRQVAACGIFTVLVGTEYISMYKLRNGLYRLSDSV
jgi:hypothetical protein